MSPMELMERLASLVPRPKVHLTRFAGVFAPHYKYRALVVPKPPTQPEALATGDAKPSKSRISRARLLKRVFGIDVETCHLCSSPMKIIAAIDDPAVITKILSHLGLPTAAPTLWPARGPPDITQDDFQRLPDFDFT